MPTWLNNAMLTILIIWTIWEIIGWSAAIYQVWNMQPWQRLLLSYNKSAWIPTLIVIICWIFVICYWLR